LGAKLLPPILISLRLCVLTDLLLEVPFLRCLFLDPPRDPPRELEWDFFLLEPTEEAESWARLSTGRTERDDLRLLLWEKGPDLADLEACLLRVIILISARSFFRFAGSISTQVFDWYPELEGGLWLEWLGRRWVP
jgi:hypothetical protein